MAQEIEIKLLPPYAFDEKHIEQEVVNTLNISIQTIQKIEIQKRSIDARKKPIVYILKLKIFYNNEIITEEKNIFNILATPNFTKKVAIIGAGPAGLFAALQLLELGIQPIVIERGKCVKERRRDLAEINKKLIVNKESNYCFGEGGAGTYSDGKLYTRSKKRGDIQKVLQTFVQYGANENILVEAHPHIGTNKLPSIIENIRAAIISNGGTVLFDTKMVDFVVQNQQIKTIICNNGKEIDVDAMILATGHSARDIFELLARKNILIEAKPFALGVRIEHPQLLIDEIQYKQKDRGEFLPPASYSVVTQVQNCGVFSFCMCPGGIIAPCATDDNEIVVNGWSPSKRNGQFANSGMVVTVEPKHWIPAFGDTHLSALSFQKNIENKAFLSTNSLVAPAQRMEDFIQNKLSNNLPKNSYIPGLQAQNLQDILPNFIANALRDGMVQFGKNLRGYRTNDAVLVGVESRTSSPVRIPRNKETLQHLEIQNLFPCGEGAGYAGGIMSAAIDGIACALAVNNLSSILR